MNTSQPLKNKYAIKRSKTGLGLFAKETLAKGSVIIEYTGTILSNKEAEERGGMYLFEVSSRRTIDGSDRSNTARYINHSCKPNCEPEIIRGRVFICAKRTIAGGEEIVYDYGKEFFNYFIKPFGCKCDQCQKKAMLP
jgi:uncharacterized protein